VAAGSQIPTEDELCRAHVVSKAPVRMAITELVRNGYLRKQAGQRHLCQLVASRPRYHDEDKADGRYVRGGVVARKEVLVKGIKVPPEDVRNYLKAEGDIYYICASVLCRVIRPILRNPLCPSRWSLTSMRSMSARRPSTR